MTDLDAEEIEGVTVQQYKVVVIGATSVGKSCLIQSYVNNQFSEQPITIGTTYQRKIVKIDHQIARLELWDTAGQERFANMVPMYYRGSQCVLVVYDVSNGQSLARAQQWLAMVKQQGLQECIVVLCANKVDMENRVISRQLGEQEAQSSNVLYYECSAKTRVGLEEMFHDLVLKLLKGKETSEQLVAIEPSNKMKKESKGCC